MPLRAHRLLDQPIIRPDLDRRMGANIDGPSLVRLPPWVEAPLGRLYLYFAAHRGRYIRLAHTDRVTGPWRVHEPGALELARSGFPSTDLAPKAADLYAHIASPDVHVVEEARHIRMYFHGRHDDGRQLTRVAVSADGLTFAVLPELLGPSYFRVFRHDGWWYALAMPGRLLRSRDGLGGFEAGPSLGEPAMRHVALARRGDRLHLLWTRVGDPPEEILHSTIGVAGDWHGWRLGATYPLLRPERSWEGADLALVPSVRGAIDEPVAQLRDPCIFEDSLHEGGEQAFLLYTGAGERGIGLATLTGL